MPYWLRQLELEVTPSTFKTHVPAYLDAGLADLPISDLAKIGGQPNIEEWLDKETWSQAIESGSEVLSDWGSSATQAIGDTYEAAKDKVGDAMDTAGEAVNRTLESLTRHLRF